QPDIEEFQLSELRYVEDGGGSNGIAFFDMTTNGRTESFVLRYAPGEQLLQQKRFEDEYLTLKAMAKYGVKAPSARWCDPSPDAIGYPFLIMDRVDGIPPPNRTLYMRGLLADATPADRRSMMLQAARFHGGLRRAAISG